MQAFRVLGFGDNTVDTYVDRGMQFPGGNAVNVAVLLARHGAEAAYLGCLGTDAAGDHLRRALAAEGVSLTRCRTVAGANARAFIAHNDGDRRFLRSEPGVRGAWGGFSDEDRSYLSGFDYVHTSIYSALEPHLAGLRASVRRLGFDFSERWSDEGLALICPLLDAVFLSFPAGDDAACEGLARHIAAHGPASVVVTRGVRGALALREGQMARVLPKPAQVVDTLGAGDAFIAAYVWASHAGRPLDETLDFAATEAALACAGFGAFGHGEPCAPEASVMVPKLKDAAHGLAYRH